MLNIINEELMAYSTIVTNENGKDYTKIRVATSNKLQQYENDIRNNKKNPGKFEKSETNDAHNTGSRIVSNIDKLKPLNREIFRVYAPIKTINEFESSDTKSVEFDLPMTIKVTTVNKYQPNVEVRCHTTGNDRTNLYVLAFPFNGMIKPIPEDPKYRIYKGVIASSAKPFFFNNHKYRKVLYLVIEINKNLFNPDHKYHTEEIDIQLESYALFEDRESGEKKTNCETFNLRILSPNGDYITSWDYKTVDEAIMMTAEPGQSLWTTYSFANRKNNDNYNKNRGKGHGNRPITYEGSTMVTTNKHGIRKEITTNNHRPRRYDNDNQVKNESIDDMMKKSGMFTNDYESRGKKNGGKRGNNSRGRK